MQQNVAQYPTEADFAALFHKRPSNDVTPGAITGTSTTTFSPLTNKPYAACFHPIED